jgi:hypothetical protein
MIGFEASFGRRGLCEQVLEDAPTDMHDTSIFADLDPEFDGHPVGVPPGVLGKRKKHATPPFRMGDDVRVMFSRCQRAMRMSSHDRTAMPCRLRDRPLRPRRPADAGRAHRPNSLILELIDPKIRALRGRFCAGELSP